METVSQTKKKKAKRKPYKSKKSSLIETKSRNAKIVRKVE